jgi:hypothetical protein
VSDWKILYQDAQGRGGESLHPTKDAAINQAVHLELYQKCQIQRIEGPGEVMLRETFVHEHLRKAGKG